MLATSLKAKRSFAVMKGPGWGKGVVCAVGIELSDNNPGRGWNQLLLTMELGSKGDNVIDVGEVDNVRVNLSTM